MEAKKAPEDLEATAQLPNKLPTSSGILPANQNAENLVTAPAHPNKRMKTVRPVQEGAIPSDFQACNTRDREFEVVAGRLAMGGFQPSYRVTIEEMARRVNGAEKLNSSSVACNLKRSKIKNGGELMRTQLAAHGVEMNLNRRQNTYPNRLISLVEAEAAHMGHDLEEAIKEYYPVEDIGKEIAKEALEDGKDEFFNKDDFLECMSAMKDVFASVIPPISGIVPRASDNKTLNYEMEDFSSMTHGFGVVCNPTWLQQVTKIGEAACKEIENKKKAYPTGN